MGNCSNRDEIQAATHAEMNSYFITINAICSPLAVILNVLLIAAFYATKQVFLNTSNFLIICISSFDLILGMIVIPLYIIVELVPSSINVCIWRKAAQILYGSVMTTSGNLTILIAVDRYLHMNPNIEDRSRFSILFDRPYIYFFVTLVAFFAFSVSVTFAEFVNLSRLSFAISYLSMMLLTAFGLSIVMVLYTKGYLRIRRFASNSPIHWESHASGVAPQYVQKLYKTVLLLVIFQMFIYIPTCIAETVFAVLGMTMSREDYSKVRVWALFAGVLMLSNSFINSLIVIFHNKDAKQWILSKTYNKCCKKTSSPEQSNNNIAAIVSMRGVQEMGIENSNIDA